MFLPGIFHGVSFTVPLAASITVFSFGTVLLKSLLTALFFAAVTAAVSGRIVRSDLKYFLSASIFCHAVFVAGKMIGAAYGAIRWSMGAEHAFRFVRTLNVQQVLEWGGVQAPPIFEQWDLFALLFIVHSAAVLQRGPAPSFGIVLALCFAHWLAVVTAQNVLMRSLAAW